MCAQELGLGILIMSSTKFEKQGGQEYAERSKYEMQNLF